MQGAKTPEAPEHEAPGAQEGDGAGEVEDEGRIEPNPEEMEEQGAGGQIWSVLFVCFVFCSGFLVSLFFFGGLRGEGDRVAPVCLA